MVAISTMRTQFLSEAQLSLLDSARLLHFLRLLESAKLRGHRHLGAAMQQIVN
jgi:hypothetical protein